MSRYVSIGAAAAMLGVAVSTLRRWEAEGRLLPGYRTPGGHRRYGLEEINRLIDPVSDERATICYARVSSHDQKGDLERQKERLAAYCLASGIDDFEVIDDLGSGLNYRKKGIRRLIRLIAQGRLGRLVVMHKDRLLRFGSEILFDLCRLHGTEVVVVEDAQDQSYEQQLACDVIELMTVFSARLYGARSHKNRKSRREEQKPNKPVAL